MMSYKNELPMSLIRYFARLRWFLVLFIIMGEIHSLRRVISTNGNKWISIKIKPPSEMSAVGGRSILFPEKQTKKRDMLRDGIFDVLGSNSTYIHRERVKATKQSLATQIRVRRKQGPAEVHREVNRIFPNDPPQSSTTNKHNRQSDVDRLILRYLPDFNQASVATLMHRSAKEWKRTKISLLTRHLPAITAYMSYLPAHEWTPREISQAIYGLQYMKSDDHRVLKYLSVMTTIVSSSLVGESVEFYDDEWEEDDVDGTDLDGYDGDDAESNGDDSNESGDDVDMESGFDGFNMEILSTGGGFVTGLAAQHMPLIPSSSSFSLSMFRETSGLLLGGDDAVEMRAENTDEDQPIPTAKEVTTMLYSLRGMRSDVVEVREFVDVLNDAIERSKYPFDVQGTGNALYGLQGMSSDHSEVRRLVSLITRRIATCPDPLDAQAIGNSLYGLRNMRSDHSEVRALLSTLADLVRKSKAVMRPQEIANALYGLQGMNSKYKEVRLLISAIKDKVLNSRVGDSGNLGATEIGASLYGFQRMSAECPEVRELLLAVSTKMLNFKVPLNAQAVGNALWGLQGMSSEYAEVRSALGVLSLHVHTADTLDSQAVSNALFGLQKMDPRWAEVRSLLSVLGAKLEYCAEPLSKQEISDAIVGMQGMLTLEAEGTESGKPSSPELQGLLGAFARLVKRSKESESFM